MQTMIFDRQLNVVKLVVVRENEWELEKREETG